MLEKNIFTIIDIINSIGINEYNKNWRKYHKENNINCKYKFKPRCTMNGNNFILSCTFDYMNKDGYIYFDYNNYKYILDI